ncbi:MAG: acyl carrier protein [Burkholderiales bacterium]
MPIGRDEVLSAIRESGVLDDVSALRDDVKLTEQGIDSLGMFNVLLVLSERHGIEIPDQDAANLNTVMQITEYLNARLP